MNPVVLYCESGYRSSIAASVVRAAGFADVSDLKGGFHAWDAAGLPVATGAGDGVAGSTPHVSPRAAEALLDKGALLLDVREPDEWRTGHAPPATLIPMGQVLAKTNDLPRDRTIVVVCRSGGRSAAVTDALRAGGFDAVNLAGGMSAWSAAGLPVVTAEDAGLVVHREEPLNCETSIPALDRRRRHAQCPLLRAQPLPHSHAQCRDMASGRGWPRRAPTPVDAPRPADHALEDHGRQRWSAPATAARCSSPRSRARNGDWAPSSTAEWTGVPLVEILDRGGAAARRRRRCFRGADSGASKAPIRCASSAGSRSTRLGTPTRCSRTR